MAKAEPSSPPSVTSHVSPPPPPPPPRSLWSSPVDFSPNPENHECECYDKLMKMNGHNVTRSEPPVRIMFYRNQCWEDFPEEIVKSLRTFFLNGKLVGYLEIEGHKFIFDFPRMVQVHLGPGDLRSIAWFDQRGKPFFPSMFLDHDFPQCSHNGRVVEVEADKKGKRKVHEEEEGDDKRKGKRKVYEEDEGDDDKRKGKRKVDEEEEGDDCGCCFKPKSLAPTSKFLNTKLLRKNDKAYLFLSSLFLRSIAKVDPEAVVTDIHKFEFSREFPGDRWDVFEKQLEITKIMRGGYANVVYAWFAAPAETVASILSKGFQSLGNVRGLFPPFRAGTFLADVDSPHLSATQCKVDQEGEKHVILCRVILGSVEKVEPEFCQTSPSRKEYDTGSDNPNDPKWYVVWNCDINTRIIPVCVVSCISPTIVPVEWKLFRCDQALLPRLVFEIKKRIHISSVPELEAIYDSFKRGMVTKDEFKKQLRAVAGYHTLLKTAHEVFGWGRC